MQLIEREDLLSALQTRLQNVAAGEGNCVFISGEAGLGKTALVKSFCKNNSEDCTVYQGACDALFTPRPLAPLYDILWQVNKTRWPVAPMQEDRATLFTNLFQELSTKKGTCIIVFEDIHWADEGTLDFIKFFARRIAQLHCLFILTYRDDEIHSRHPLRNVLGQLPPDSFTKLLVAPLSKKAVETMAFQKGYSGEDVYSISGGNPFYVNEILASYSPGVPENIKDAILAVYDRQEEGTKNAWQITSVVPDGLELDRFAKIKTSWKDAMDHCFAMHVIIVQNNKVVFKHELYRRTIEESLSPFKRIELNKLILDTFLEDFAHEGEIERIVHYAKNANENKTVLKYAPIAAKQAMSTGAHLEAARLFHTAIDYSDGIEADQLVQLYEAYAYECYLTARINDAILYQDKALKIWQQKKDVEQTGNCLRFLSRLWSVNGNREKAESFGRQAIDALAQQASSRAKGLAFSNMAKLHLLAEELSDSIDWGKKAITIADEINDEDIVCHALNSIGAAEWLSDPAKETGKDLLLKSLGIALQHHFHEHAARAYTALICNSLDRKNYAQAKEFLPLAISYCEERGLDSANSSNRVFEARILFDTGRWDKASASAAALLQHQSQPAPIKMSCQLLLSAIKIRRREFSVVHDLLQVKELAFKTKEYQRILPIMITLLEYEWLSSKQIITEEEIIVCIRMVKKVKNDILNSAFAFWLRKAGRKEIELSEWYEPYQLLRVGKIKEAAAFWKNKHCPFEEAMALFEGTEETKKMALQIFKSLDAGAICDRITMEMRAVGIKRIPRGLRESTKGNPAQLTNRELDIIYLLQTAVQNKEIADMLFISAKTVDNHISNIFYKLEVNSRSKAVAEAVRLGILK